MHLYICRHGTQILVRVQSGQNKLTISLQYCVGWQIVQINVVKGIGFELFLGIYASIQVKSHCY